MYSFMVSKALWLWWRMTMGELPAGPGWEYEGFGRRLLRVHTLHPTALTIAVLRTSGTVSQSRNFWNQAPDFDRVTAEDLVENLNAMGYAAFSNVSEEVRIFRCSDWSRIDGCPKDLFITADLLEVQSADRTWFSGWEANMTLTFSSYLMGAESSSMMSDSQDSVYRLFLPSVNSYVQAYNILRKWIISKLVAPKLGIRTR